MAAPDAPVKAAIYCRVSTEEQSRPDKVSLAVQEERGRAYCEERAYAVAGIYTDAGFSGAEENRPALLAMLADARERKIDRVVAYCLDRLDRDPFVGGMIERELEKARVAIEYVTETYEDSPFGELMRDVRRSFAKFERLMISHRTRMGKLGQAKKGHYNTGWTAFGYDYDRETRKLVVNEMEAAVVSRIFSMYAREGLSQAKIAGRLNAEGVATKTLQTRSLDGVKKGWWKGQIARVLTNPIYKGEAHYGKTSMIGKGQTRRKQSQPPEEWVRIDCPAIVSDDLWEAVQKRSERVRRHPQTPAARKSAFLLSGLIRCKPCGRPMYGYTLRKRRRGELKTWPYYYCSGQHRYGYDCREHERVNAERIEGPVLEAVVDAFSDPERVLETCRAYGDQLRAQEDENEGVVATLRRNLGDAASSRDVVIALCTKGKITEADLSRQLTAIEKETADWQTELSRLEEATRQRETAREVEEAARAIADQIRPTIEEMTLDEKKALLQALVERVWVGRDGEMTIECAVPDILPATGEHDYARRR